MNDRWETLHIYERHLSDLRHFLARCRAPWPQPRLRDLDLFLELGAERWKRTTVAGAAGTFRAWLRFLFVTGRSQQNLASSVMLPPSISYPRPARAMPWSMVRQLRRGIDPGTALGRRDTAQYLLFCAYGLSNAELINLKLEDIDWDANILHIRRLKNSSTVDLPLSATVAKAIARYLRHGRPPTSSRHVFVRHCIPFGPLGHGTVGRPRCKNDTVGEDCAKAVFKFHACSALSGKGPPPSLPFTLTLHDRDVTIDGKVGEALDQVAGLLAGRETHRERLWVDAFYAAVDPPEAQGVLASAPRDIPAAFPPRRTLPSPIWPSAERSLRHSTSRVPANPYVFSLSCLAPVRQ
jgi:hypothetical protein